MTKHHLKIDQNWYARIVQGLKKAELRFNDRDFQVGDEIIFNVNGWIENSIFYKDVSFIITHVLTSDVCEGLQKGYCILSFEILPKIK